MFRWLKEKLSIQLSKYPGRVVLGAILLLNVVFIFLAAFVISLLSVSGTENMNFWHASYYTIMMVLDGGCVESVVGDVGVAGVALVIVCLIIVIVGMVLFTGAVIGYLTNYISGFIENANLGSHKIYLSGHTVILNWNSRASEIINDHLYRSGKQYIVILVPSGKEGIEKEISERIADTVAQENANRKKGSKRFKNNLVVIVREGDTFSTKQFQDISLEKANSIIILGSDVNNTLCKYEAKSAIDSRERGNPQVIKALVQVAELASGASSSDDQKIVVEVEDEWTLLLVEKIIDTKQVSGKCNIIPVSVNKILGRLLSQFSLMPELNLVYRDLFSNKGTTFYVKDCEEENEEAWMRKYLSEHLHSIPLSVMEEKGGRYAFYSAESEKDDGKTTSVETSDYTVKLNRNYWLEQKNVIILGHNSKIRDIMEGFNSFREEWNFDGNEILNIVVVDDKAHLEKMDYYKAYPYVRETVEAEIYDKDLICKKIEEMVDANETDTSVLILSDDAVLNSDIDSGAIANLIYVRDVIKKKKQNNPDFDEGKIDVVVEIINPKHHDIVKSYSVNNVVISNRYISKMVTQLGEKDTLYDFYQDILSYDGVGERDSKEIYVKKVTRFFEEIPAECTAAELIRAVYEASADPSLSYEQRTYTVVLGYVKKNGEMVLFSGDQSKIKVKLEATDKLIVFANH